MNSKELISKPEVSFWVPIIIAIIGVATSFAVLNNRVANNEMDIIKAETKMDAAVERVETQFDQNGKALVDIQVRLAEIQKDILYIKENMRN